MINPTDEWTAMLDRQAQERGRALRAERDQATLRRYREALERIDAKLTGKPGDTYEPWEGNPGVSAEVRRIARAALSAERETESRPGDKPPGYHIGVTIDGKESRFDAVAVEESAPSLAEWKKRAENAEAALEALTSGGLAAAPKQQPDQTRRLRR